MQIHIDTVTDGPDEYRAALAALNEMLGGDERPKASAPSVLNDPEVAKMVDDFRAVVQAEDDAEAAQTFGNPHHGHPDEPIGVNTAPPATVTVAGVTAVYVPSGIDPTAQYQALGGALPVPTPLVSPPDVDKHGIPWDVRIHAGGKTKNADGSWRGKRGVSSDVVQAVTAELTGGRAPAPAVSPPMAPPSATQAPPPPPSGPTFMDVTTANMAAIQAGKWTAAQAVALAQTLGLESIAGLQGRPDLIPAYLAGVPQ